MSNGIIYYTNYKLVKFVDNKNGYHEGMMHKQISMKV